MNNITPEMIKVVAEGMGYFSVKIQSDGVSALKERYSIRCTYDPPTNPAQDSEIEIKLEITTYRNWAGDTWVAELRNVNKRMQGNTPAEARFMAAYNYFKGDNNEQRNK